MTLHASLFANNFDLCAFPVYRKMSDSEGCLLCLHRQVSVDIGTSGTSQGYTE